MVATLVQFLSTAHNSTGGTPADMGAITNTPQPGDLLMVMNCAGGSASGSVTSVTGCGATWVRAGYVRDPNGLPSEIDMWVARDATTTGSVTMTGFSGTDNGNGYLYHWRGLSTGALQVQTTSRVGAGTLTLPTATAQNGQAVVALTAAYDSTGTRSWNAPTTPTTGWTMGPARENGNAASLDAYRIPSEASGTAHTVGATQVGTFGIVGATVLLGAPVAGTYPTEVAADLPLAYYRLGEGSGTALVDSSGNAHNGTYAGTAAWVSGLVGGDGNQAVRFNGTNTRGVVADAAWMRPGLLTAEAIITPSALAAGNHTIVARNSTAAAFYLRTEGTTLAGAVVPTTGGFTRVTAVRTLEVGLAYHVALTWDGDRVVLYVNGAQDGVSQLSGSLITTAAADFTIGANAFTTPSEFFAGTIDEVAYYGTPLSATRIAQHYSATASLTAALVSRGALQTMLRQGAGDALVSRGALTTLVRQAPGNALVSRAALQVLVSNTLYRPYLRTVGSSRAVQMKQADGSWWAVKVGKGQ